MGIGDNLKISRKNNELTLEKAARSLGLTAGQLSRIERGESDTSIQRLAQFSELYGVTLLELVLGPDYPVSFLQLKGAVGPDPGEVSEKIVPLPRLSRTFKSTYALECRDPGMDEIYPRGSLFVCVPIAALGRRVVVGDHVIFTRRTVGKGEVRLVREFRLDQLGQSWLWPRSADPDHQQPLPVPSENLQLEAVVLAYFAERAPFG